MSMRDFIRRYRAVIDKKIPANVGRVNDNERRIWVANDWELYSLARYCGVRVCKWH